MNTTTIFVVLPGGTEIAAANYAGAPNFHIGKPVVALVKYTWNESFKVEAIYDREGRSISTGFRVSFVLSAIGNFASGKTQKEAWEKFDKR